MRYKKLRRVCDQLLCYRRLRLLKNTLQRRGCSVSTYYPRCDLDPCCISAGLVAKHGDVKTFCQSWDVTFHIWMKHSWRGGRIAQSEASCVFPLQFFDLLSGKKTILMHPLCRVPDFSVSPSQTCFRITCLKVQNVWIRRSSCTLKITIDRRCCSSYVITRGNLNFSLFIMGNYCYITKLRILSFSINAVKKRLCFAIIDVFKR